ncbi:MAG: Cyanophycin synthetase, partial [Planctomycetota bacterium]
MDFRRIRTLHGPNYWANFPVLEAVVDLGELRDQSSEMLPGFNDRLRTWLPSLIEHRCSVGERGGFFQRLERGTYMAHVLEHVTLELQTLAGSQCGFGRARELEEDGVYKVAIQYEEESLARHCLETGRRLVLAAVHDHAFEVETELKQLRELSYDVRLGPSTFAIVRAAKARSIPFRRLNKSSLVQIGHGSKARRICTAETDRTSAIAESIAQDKELTRKLLRA